MIDCRIKRVFESPPDAAYFFGYFDTPQVSQDGQRILAMRVARIDRVPEPADTAEVGWFQIGDPRGEFQKIGETSAFNWQQGAMLQFLGPDYCNRVVWNCFDGSSYRACLFDLTTGDCQFVPAIYCPFPDGQSALSVDFERHFWCRRGYSYGHIQNAAKDTPILQGDAISKVEFLSGQATPIVSIEALLDLKPRSTMAGAAHYLEHVKISPNGRQFAFLHRWRHSNGIHSRLLMARSDGSDIQILNDSGRMSHFCWKDDRTLLGYGGRKTAANVMRRNKAAMRMIFKPLLPIYKKLVRDNSDLAKSLTGAAYYLLDIERPGAMELVTPDLRSEDGHPAAIAGSDWFVTDTYARAQHGRRPKLHLANAEDGRHQVLDELLSIAEHDETPTRCDLHPRVSPSGDIVSIDTMDGGQRRIYAYQLDVQQ